MFKLRQCAVCKIFLAAAIGVIAGGGMASESKSSLSLKIFSAGEVAYRDFSQSINGRVDISSELSIYLADIDNYRITLLAGDGDYYVVEFLPKPYKGQTLRGGGVQYKIANEDLHVIDIVKYK